MNTDPSTWCLGDPEAYKCGHCKKEFDFLDAALDHLPGEGYLRLCPFCGSEDLVEAIQDRYDPEEIE